MYYCNWCRRNPITIIIVVVTTLLLWHLFSGYLITSSQIRIKNHIEKNESDSGQLRGKHFGEAKALDHRVDNLFKKSERNVMEEAKLNPNHLVENQEEQSVQGKHDEILALDAANISDDRLKIVDKANLDKKVDTKKRPIKEQPSEGELIKMIKGAIDEGAHIPGDQMDLADTKPSENDARMKKESLDKAKEKNKEHEVAAKGREEVNALMNKLGVSLKDLEEPNKNPQDKPKKMKESESLIPPGRKHDELPVIIDVQERHKLGPENDIKIPPVDNHSKHLRGPSGNQVKPGSEALSLSNAFDMSLTPFVKLMISIDGERQGPIIFNMFVKEAPQTVRNFETLCTGWKTKDGEIVTYKKTPFHRIVKDFVMQGGKVHLKDGEHGSIYGSNWNDETGALKNKHTGIGALSMANAGPNTNGTEFFITFGSAEHLDGKHAVFGQAVSGMDVIDLVNRRTGIDGGPTTRVEQCELLSDWSPSFKDAQPILNENAFKDAQPILNEKAFIDIKEKPPKDEKAKNPSPINAMDNPPLGAKPNMLPIINAMEMPPPPMFPP